MALHLVSLKFGLFKEAVTANAKSAAHRRNIGIRNGLDESDFDLLDERTYPKLHKHIKVLGKKYSPCPIRPSNDTRNGR